MLKHEVQILETVISYYPLLNSRLRAVQLFCCDINILNKYKPTHFFNSPSLKLETWIGPLFHSNINVDEYRTSSGHRSPFRDHKRHSRPRFFATLIKTDAGQWVPTLRWTRHLGKPLNRLYHKNCICTLHFVKYIAGYRYNRLEVSTMLHVNTL